MDDFPDIINCLMRLIITIQNPAPWDRFMGAKFTDTSAYEEYDTQHVSEKFEGIDSQLAQRLGKAISRRRQSFKYREARHEKLSHQVDGQADSDLTESASQSIEHVQTQHQNMIRDDQIDILVKLSSRPLGESAEVTCELCSETLSSLKNYRRHVGRHQQQLALFALPMVDEPDAERGQTNQQQDSDSDTEAEADSNDETKAESKDKTISKDKTASRDNADSQDKTDSKDKGRGPGNHPPTTFTVNISSPLQAKPRPS
ncbi:uncharacterized protein N0V96_001538 [Colletotrichum fioriniae]|uniref:uncharacterized protein n=1 Tax=Colletotrichum fioriniae TaxID=710243 RepID=UPI0032DB89A6|nr:hypothetical protein N0V96_001538 [Colletotrichum fioriniae]